MNLFRQACYEKSGQLSNKWIFLKYADMYGLFLVCLFRDTLVYGYLKITTIYKFDNMGNKKNNSKCIFLFAQRYINIYSVG